MPRWRNGVQAARSGFDLREGDAASGVELEELGLHSCEGGWAKTEQELGQQSQLSGDLQNEDVGRQESPDSYVQLRGCAVPADEQDYGAMAKLFKGL